MQTYELSYILKDMYDSATRDKTTMIHLFAIKYAKELQDNNIQLKELLKNAGMPESYVTEINKGLRLSKYVEIKADFK